MSPGYVLAGGASRRMGQDKAQVRFRGVPLAVRMANTLLQAGCASVHLVGKRTDLQDLGHPLLLEEQEEHHPLYGVATALRSADAELALIAPCDLVHLTAETVQALLHFGGPCVATGSDQTHPLLAVLPTQWADEALDLAQSGAGAHALVRPLPRVTVPDRDLYDANHPHDLDTDK